MTTTRVERNTASGIECVTKITVLPACSQIRRSSRLRRSRVISSSAPKGSSMRSSDGSNESARAIETRCCMPPESCHGRLDSNPTSSTSSSISRTRSLRRSRLQPEHLERERDVPGDGAPVVQHRVLEHDAVVVVEPCPMRRLPVHEHRPRARLDEVADDAQQRRLAAAGGADQGDELAGPDLEVDVEESGRAGAEGLREPRHRDHVRGRRLGAHTSCSGARRTTRCSARTTQPKKTSPSAAHTMFVAQRKVGCSE